MNRAARRAAARRITRAPEGRKEIARALKLIAPELEPEPEPDFPALGRAGFVKATPRLILPKR